MGMSAALARDNISRTEDRQGQESRPPPLFLFEAHAFGSGPGEFSCHEAEAAAKSSGPRGRPFSFSSDLRLSIVLRSEKRAHLGQAPARTPR